MTAALDCRVASLLAMTVTVNIKGIYPRGATVERTATIMPFAFAILIGFQLIGEIVRQAFGLSLPGPLIGMVLLAVTLAVRGRGADPNVAPPSPLVRTSNGLIAAMGLLFVPAGVGVVAEMDLLREQWLPILGGLVVSTLLGLAVTALAMHHVSRIVDARTPAARPQVR